MEYEIYLIILIHQRHKELLHYTQMHIKKKHTLTLIQECDLIHHLVLMIVLLYSESDYIQNDINTTIIVTDNDINVSDLVFLIIITIPLYLIQHID